MFWRYNQRRDARPLFSDDPFDPEDVPPRPCDDPNWWRSETQEKNNGSIETLGANHCAHAAFVNRTMPSRSLRAQQPEQPVQPSGTGVEWRFQPGHGGTATRQSDEPTFPLKAACHGEGRDAVRRCRSFFPVVQERDQSSANAPMRRVAPSN